jgi:Zn-dependent metalloprotease
VAAAAVAAASFATFLPGAAGVAGSEPSRRDAAIGRARQNLRSHGRDARASGADGFDATDVVFDADGTEHVRFDRTYKGLTVIGGDLVVHETAKGDFRSASLTLAAPIDVDTTPATSEDDAVATARAAFSGSIADAKAERLVVWARTDRPVLAREVLVTGTAPDGGPSELHVLVDATSGAVVDAWDGIEHAKPGSGGGGTTTPPTVSCNVPAGVGRTLYSGDVCMPTTFINKSTGYRLDGKAADAGSSVVQTYDYRGTTSMLYYLNDADNVWGNNTSSDGASAASDAQYGALATWRYYQSLGRNGIDGSGGTLQSRVHYGRNYNNAFWSDTCTCMVYGDGDGRRFKSLVSLDVAGHEMTHGVTSRTSNLAYSLESGGLNESTSDVFGTMVEKTRPTGGNYTIGEQVVVPGAFPGNALRIMYKPSLDGASADCWSDTVGSLDVHYSSGVGNHAFYLLAEGSSPINGNPTSPTCDGSVVTGIGADAAARIWYKANSTYWTSGTDYHGARAGMLTAATDLYGGSSPERAAVAAAWAAVGVS